VQGENKTKQTARIVGTEQLGIPLHTKGAALEGDRGLSRSQRWPPLVGEPGGDPGLCLAADRGLQRPRVPGQRRRPPKRWMVGR
jgi:hypothetical protein